MDLLWCQLFKEAYDKGVYEVSADFLVPALVLYLTVTCAINLSKKEFMRAQKLEEEKENKTNRQILDIVRNSLDSTLGELPQILNYLKGFKNLDFNTIEKVPRYTLDPSYLDSLLRIDLVTLVNAIESDSRHSDFDVVSFAAHLNGLKSIYGLYDREDQNFSRKLGDFYTRYHADYINVLSEVTLFHSANNTDISRTLNILSVALGKELETLNNLKDVDLEDKRSRVYVIHIFIRKVIEILLEQNDPELLATKLFQLCTQCVVSYESMKNNFDFFDKFCQKQRESLDSTYEDLVQYRKLLD